jgi:hypothetical protein
VTTATAGMYTLTSASSINTYGYLYKDPVDSTHPSQNLIMSDDDSGGDRQFRLTGNLSYATIYVLIITTLDSNVPEHFSVSVSGPSFVDLTAFIPTTNRSIRTTSQHSVHRSTLVGIDSFQQHWVFL